jgi:hypothetical protein
MHEDGFCERAPQNPLCKLLYVEWKRLKMKKRFYIPFIVVSSYYFAWHLSHIFGVHWHTGLNIPGFLMFKSAWPWNSINDMFLLNSNNYLSDKMAIFLRVLVTCVGFTINIAILTSLIILIRNRLFHAPRNI